MLTRFVEWLKAAGCEVVQGYLCGKPAPLIKVEQDGSVSVQPAPERRVANLH